MNREPIVDSGMIQVGLAVTAVGFVLADRKDIMTFYGEMVFISGGVATVTLYAVYLFYWLREVATHSPVGASFALSGHLMMFIILTFAFWELGNRVIGIENYDFLKFIFFFV